MTRFVALLLATVAMHISPTAASAEMSDASYRDAMGAIIAYARDMTTVVPCVYMSLSVPEGMPDKVEENWGDKATLGTFTLLLREGASPAQMDTFLSAYRDNYKPKWSVDDVRTAPRACHALVEAAVRMSGVGAPLLLRPPFSMYSKR